MLWCNMKLIYEKHVGVKYMRGLLYFANIIITFNLCRSILLFSCKYSPKIKRKLVEIFYYIGFSNDDIN